MTLEQFIDKTKLEYAIQYETKDISAYINSKAKEEAKNSNSICIDDETIKTWILSYKPKKEEKNKEETKEEPKKEVLENEPKKENIQCSLF